MERVRGCERGLVSDALLARLQEVRQKCLLRKMMLRKRVEGLPAEARMLVGGLGCRQGILQLV